uniref:Neurotransmitter-gated ion-channel transmembrane domain-containing protein n=1 Tax=Sphaeramia orbicularis TaxID=375764 RepID=A0A672YIV4_9TELE
MLIDILSFYLPTANGTPIIGIYFSVCLALMVISLLETVIITNVLHHNSLKYQEVPQWVRVVVLKHIARLICYRWPEEDSPCSVHPKDRPANEQGTTDQCTITPANPTAPQPPTITEYVQDLRLHLASVQREGDLQNQWCHVGYVLDFLLFRVYLLLISCYALIIISMWCIWISQG